jgi:hypothetical protein
MLGLSVLMFTQQGGMLGTLVRGIGREFSPAGGTTGLDFCGLFFGEARNFYGRNFFRAGRFVFGFFFALFFFEFGATDHRIGFGFRLGFLVLGLDKTGS